MERDRIFVRATAFVKDRRISGSPDLCARRFPVRLLTKQIRISGLVEVDSRETFARPGINCRTLERPDNIVT